MPVASSLPSKSDLILESRLLQHLHVSVAPPLSRVPVQCYSIPPDYPSSNVRVVPPQTMHSPAGPPYPNL